MIQKVALEKTKELGLNMLMKHLRLIILRKEKE